MQKAGMQHEARLRQHTKKWGRFEDLDLYGILVDEWRQQAAAGDPGS
jgi:ribosomal-protein-alanine N-acetyltransferase